VEAIIRAHNLSKVILCMQYRNITETRWDESSNYYDDAMTVRWRATTLSHIVTVTLPNPSSAWRKATVAKLNHTATTVHSLFTQTRLDRHLHAYTQHVQHSPSS
jgi:hypothetical protein